MSRTMWHRRVLTHQALRQIETKTAGVDSQRRQIHIYFLQNVRSPVRSASHTREYENCRFKKYHFYVAQRATQRMNAQNDTKIASMHQSIPRFRHKNKMQTAMEQIHTNEKKINFKLKFFELHFSHLHSPVLVSAVGSASPSVSVRVVSF